LPQEATGQKIHAARLIDISKYIFISITIYIDVANQLKKRNMNYKPKNEKEALALELASKLSDLANLRLYISYAYKYPESVMRKALGEVMEVPFGKIRKSRGALFNHLVQKYAKENPGD
jgi:hypothetical protein